jgi:hypothetical protein
LAEDPELARLGEKARQGAIDVLEAVLSNPHVQALIRRSVLRETFKGGLAFALLFTGIFIIYNATKAALGYDWRVDLILGAILFLGGLRYIIRGIR